MQDPLITKGNVCARTAAVILDAFNELNRKAKLVTVPVYIAHGEQLPELWAMMACCEHHVPRNSK